MISIGDEAFENCGGLTSFTIPNSVTSIGQNVFYGTAWYNNQAVGIVYKDKFLLGYKGTMPANTAITINDGTTVISNGVFLNESNLTSVNIPGSVINIGHQAFYGSGLTSVTIGNGLTHTNIGDYAFNECSSLTSVTIGTCVTNIGYAAFAYCTNLTKITVKNPVPPTTLEYVTFAYVNKGTCALEVPIGSKAAYETATGWKDFLTINEVDFTDAVPEHNVDNLKIYSDGNVLVLEGVAAGKDVHVYNPSGVLIYSEVLQGEKTAIPVMGKGVYIVCTSGCTVKVLVE